MNKKTKKYLNDLYFFVHGSLISANIITIDIYKLKFVEYLCSEDESIWWFFYTHTIFLVTNCILKYISDTHILKIYLFVSKILLLIYGIIIMVDCNYENIVFINIIIINIVFDILIILIISSNFCWNLYKIKYQLDENYSIL